MAAVIWTDVVQLSLYSRGRGGGDGCTAAQDPGGMGDDCHRDCRACGQVSGLRSGMELDGSYTLLGGGDRRCVPDYGEPRNGPVDCAAAAGGAQREAGKMALMASGVAVFGLFALFLLIGAMLFVFYRAFRPARRFREPTRFSHVFIATRMPHVLAGLLISAILAAAMSNLSAALNSLSSITWWIFTRGGFRMSTKSAGCGCRGWRRLCGRGAVWIGHCGAQWWNGAGDGAFDCVGGLWRRYLECFCWEC